MVISNLSELIVSTFVLTLLFWIIVDVSKTLLKSICEDENDETFNCDCKKKEKSSRRYRYDSDILNK